MKSAAGQGGPVWYIAGAMRPSAGTGASRA
jgi:hypothetical protein